MKNTHGRIIKKPVSSDHPHKNIYKEQEKIQKLTPLLNKAAQQTGLKESTIQGCLDGTTTLNNYLEEKMKLIDSETLKEIKEVLGLEV
jgi:hypothetical protein